MSGNGNDQLQSHFANGTHGRMGSTPYSEWVITAALKRFQVLGSFGLGSDRDGNEVEMSAVLDGMVGWCKKANHNRMPAARVLCMLPTLLACVDRERL